jgi:hypothetical protein
MWETEEYGSMDVLEVLKIIYEYKVLLVPSKLPQICLYRTHNNKTNIICIHFYQIFDIQIFFHHKLNQYIIFLSQTKPLACLRAKVYSHGIRLLAVILLVDGGESSVLQVSI